MTIPSSVPTPLSVNITKKFNLKILKNHIQIHPKSPQRQRSTIKFTSAEFDIKISRKILTKNYMKLKELSTLIFRQATVSNKMQNIQ